MRTAALVLEQQRASRSFSSNSPCPAKWRTSTPPFARRRWRRPAVAFVRTSTSAFPVAARGRKAVRRSEVSVFVSRRGVPRGCETTTRIAAGPSPRGCVGGHGGEGVADDVDAGGGEELAPGGSKASSQGLSATQSIMEVNTTSSGPPSAKRGPCRRDGARPPGAASRRGPGPVAQLLSRGQRLRGSAALENGERPLVHADDPLPARAGLAATAGKAARTRALRKVARTCAVSGDIPPEGSGPPGR